MLEIWVDLLYGAAGLVEMFQLFGEDGLGGRGGEGGEIFHSELG